MTDPFLRAILEAPDDTDLRLVYADALEEQDTPASRARAEFIRVQVELAGWSGKCLKRPLATADAEPLALCCAVCDLRLRERELFNDHGIVWRHQEAPWSGAAYAGVLPRPAGCNPCHVLYRRGLVEHVSLSLADFCGELCRYEGRLAGGRKKCPNCAGGYAAALFAACPITRVTLTDCQPFHSESATRSWSWWDVAKIAVEVHPQSSLPSKLWEALPINEGDVRTSYYKRYPIEAAAHAALSAACVRYGRDLVNPSLKRRREDVKGAAHPQTVR